MSEAKGESKGAAAPQASKPANSSQSSGGQSSKGQSSGNDGFISGLQFWVIFLVAFVLLRFPLALAIVFGAIAGLAGGFCVGWWQDERQIKGQERDIAIRNPGMLAKLDTEILLNPNEDFSEEYVDPRQQRRSRYVSNRPYNVSQRRRELKSLLPWRGISSRPRS